MVSYFAVAVTRENGDWTATEVDLTTASDVEEVADQLREADAQGDVGLLFVEIDDEYLAILRLDDGEDLRIFGSDAAMVAESRLGNAILGDVEVPGDVEPGDLEVNDNEVKDNAPAPTASDEDPDEESEDDEPDEVDDDEDDTDFDAASSAALLTDARPLGETDLLANLGVDPAHLLDLCSRDGMLPSDITAELCQAIGCGDEVEELRGA